MCIRDRATTIRQHRLQWAGYIIRMEGNRIPRKVAYCLVKSRVEGLLEDPRNTGLMQWQRMLIIYLKKNDEHRLPRTGKTEADDYGGSGSTLNCDAIEEEVQKDSNMYNS